MFGEVTLEDPVGYFGTGAGTIEVVLGKSPAYYQLHTDSEDFDALFAVLVGAWRSGARVRATIRGTAIVALERA